MNYESTCQRKKEESLKISKKRNETTPFNQKRNISLQRLQHVPGDLEVISLNNALETSEHEGYFFHNYSYTSLYIHSKPLLYATIYVNYFKHREINKHNTKDHSKQLLRIITTYSEIPLTL